ncbi:MAG: tRNA pseudouridine(38-40) synthase TruA [Bacteriovoracaceae bacterium]
MKKYYYKATIQYDGTDYSGFQWQDGLRTIQGDFLAALASIAGPSASLRAASRTDSGVHALGQVIRITSEKALDLEKAPDLLNGLLHKQIRCLDMVETEKHFKPAHDCTSKEYRYLFTNTPGESGEKRRFIANNPYPLNLDLMRTCIELLIGEHDFQNFVSLGKKNRPTVRRITSCELSLIDPREFLGRSQLFPVPDDLKTCYELRVEGSGFMKHMIRHLTTALWKVGNKRLQVSEFQRLLTMKERVKPTWKLASPKGLFLSRIDY